MGKSLNSAELVQLVKSFKENEHPREENGKFTSGADTEEVQEQKEKKSNDGISQEQLSEITKKLEDLAVPMMKVEYSKDEYNRLFPEGIVKTPIKTVKMGTDQFAKLGRKDGGNRQSYIGAAYQTLTDPVVIIKEENDDIYIKSFTTKNGISTFMSVEKDKRDGRFIITNYRRKTSQVIKKIKWADSIVYLKNNRGSPACMDKEGVPHADSSHTSLLSPDSIEKSRGNCEKNSHIVKSFKENEHPREENGKFTSGADTEEVQEQKENKSNNGISQEQLSEITKKLEDLAVPMMKVEFSRDNYNKLFPEGIVKTPLEHVKLGEHQFEKLELKKRTDLLGSMYQTLSDPVVVLSETREGKEARLYIKTFSKEGNAKINSVMSVVVDIDNQPVAISTGHRKVKQIENKIKMAGIPLYLKTTEGSGSPTIGTGSNTSVAQQDNISDISHKKSRGNCEKNSHIVKSFNENEHPREENGKFTSGGNINKREAWDSSTDKAKELKAEDWGTPQEIIEMATMPRTAKNREEAIVILKEIAKKGPLISKSGIIATLSGKSIDEITSGQEKSKSLNAAAHWLAAANIDKLFSNAIEPWQFELDPHKNNENLKDRKYLYAPMRYNNRVIPIRITVKEYKEKESTERIYSIMAIDTDIKIGDYLKDQTVLDIDVSLKKSQEHPSNSPFDTNNTVCHSTREFQSTHIEDTTKIISNISHKKSRGNCEKNSHIVKSFKENEHPREENGKFTSGADTEEVQEQKENKSNDGISQEQLSEITKKLEDLAIPMMEVEYSRDEYNRLFKRGEVKTPIKTVKMGTDQFAKLGRKDGGNRQSYIGAAYQTLTDPVVIIKEENDDVYIKSFVIDDGVATFMSVETDTDTGRFIITNYRRHKNEIIRKIKWADGILYIKGDSGSPASMDKESTPHADSSHTSLLSPDSIEKSRGNCEKNSHSNVSIHAPLGCDKESIKNSPRKKKGEENMKLEAVLENLKKSLGLKKSLDDEKQVDFEAEAQEAQEDDNPEEEEGDEDEEEEEEEKHETEDKKVYGTGSYEVGRTAGQYG